MPELTAYHEAGHAWMFQQQTAELRQLLEQANHWAALTEIADQLLAHERLEGEAVAQCIRQWL